MDTGIRLEILWNDTDVFEVRVSACNGIFSGSANIYVAIGGLAESAQDLAGFPQNPSDRRKLQFGVFGPEIGGGAVAMDFYCKDSGGHALVELRIESDHRDAAPAQSVFLVSAVEPAAVDLFVADLQRLERDQRGKAFLRAGQYLA